MCRGPGVHDPYRRDDPGEQTTCTFSFGLIDPLLTHDQIDHDRTFGVLPSFLAGRIDALRDELTRALRDAFGAYADERPDNGGIAGHYLPVMSAERTPASLSLVEPLLDLAGELLGRPALPTSVEARLLLGQSGMHTDVGFDIVGVNLVAYFDRLRGPNGALRVLPGTQHQPCRETDSSRCARTPSTLPG